MKYISSYLSLIALWKQMERKGTWNGPYHNRFLSKHLQKSPFGLLNLNKFILCSSYSFSQIFHLSLLNVLSHCNYNKVTASLTAFIFRSVRILYLIKRLKEFYQSNARLDNWFVWELYYNCRIIYFPKCSPRNLYD